MLPQLPIYIALLGIFEVMSTRPKISPDLRLNIASVVPGSQREQRTVLSLAVIYKRSLFIKATAAFPKPDTINKFATHNTR